MTKKLAMAVEHAFGATLGFQFANWKKYTRFCQRRKRKLAKIFAKLHGADKTMVKRFAFNDWVEFLVMKNQGLQRMDKLRSKALLTRAGEYFTRWSTYASAMAHMNLDMYDLREPINRREVLSPERMRESRRALQRFSIMYGGDAVVTDADDVDSLMSGVKLSDRAEMMQEIHSREEPLLQLQRRSANGASGSMTPTVMSTKSASASRGGMTGNSSAPRSGRSSAAKSSRFTSPSPGY